MQLTEVGATLENGARVLKRVEVEHKSEQEPAPIHLRHMAARIVRETTRRNKNATLSHAVPQVGEGVTLN